jgi:hypothetical protein
MRRVLQPNGGWATDWKLFWKCDGAARSLQMNDPAGVFPANTKISRKPDAADSDAGFCYLIVTSLTAVCNMNCPIYCDADFPARPDAIDGRSDRTFSAQVNLPRSLPPAGNRTAGHCQPQTE